MKVEKLLADWRSTYGEWVSTELQLREVRQRASSGRTVSLLEERVRALKQHCSDCQDAVAAALASRSDHSSGETSQSLRSEHASASSAGLPARQRLPEGDGRPH